MHLFDLTKEVKLNKELQKKYAVARAVLHVVFLIAVFFVLYRILFPIIPLNFDLNTPNSTKNSLVSVRTNKTNEFPSKGIVASNDTLSFNANPIGQFSNANISFVLKKNTSGAENTPIKIQKSYQAFFYPVGKPVGFKNATLVSTSDGSYYIVSNGMLRKFSNTDIILELGYPKSAFVEISDDSLKLNNPGEDIADAGNYPDDTLFAIDDTYYQLKDQQLMPFVSAGAFLSQFNSASAIAKKSDFLSRYPASKTSAGFADGTLVSSAESVFVLSEGKSYPVENEVTFSAMGFDWKNVVPVSADVLGTYKKQKQFTNNDSHPNGTIFVDQQTNQHFLIKDGQRRPIDNTDVMSTYSKQSPIVADSSAATKESSCVLKKKLFSSNAYSCEVSLENLTALVGNDYQISADFQANANLSSINVTFSTPLTFDSLKNSLSVIKNKLKNR